MKVFVAVGSGKEASAWGKGATPEAAVADAVERVNKLGEDTGEDPWEDEDPAAWARKLKVVAIEGPVRAVETILRELLS